MSGKRNSISSLPLSLHAIAVNQVKGLQVFFTLLHFQVQFQKEIHALLYLLPDIIFLIFQSLGLHALPFVTLLGIHHDHLVTACSRHSALKDSQNCE